MTFTIPTEIMAQAKAVFGNREKPMAWLRSRQTRFGSKTALELATTEQGARLVRAGSR